MGDSFNLIDKRLVDLFFAMAMEIHPEGRDTVQVALPLDIDEGDPLSSGNDGGSLLLPFLHLGERVPNQPFPFFDPIFGGKDTLLISFTTIPFFPWIFRRTSGLNAAFA